MRFLFSALILLTSSTLASAAGIGQVNYTPAAPDDPEIAALIASEREALVSATPTDRPQLQVARVGGSIIVQGSNSNSCGAFNCMTVVYRGGRKIAEKLACDGSAGDHKLYMDGRWLFACGWFIDLATGQRPRVTKTPPFPAIEIDHNGSKVVLDGTNGVISYSRPKAAIAGTIKQGDILVVYENRKTAGIYASTMVGTAWVYKKGCDPVAYPVAEAKVATASWALQGQAPIWSGCEVVGYRESGPNNLLKFDSRSARAEDEMSD